MKHIVAGMFVLCLPLLAGATEVIGDDNVLNVPSAPTVEATAPTAGTALAGQPKFFPLADLRNGRPQSKEPVQFRQQPMMRSDSAAINNGFMRIDRKLAPIAPQHTIATQSDEPTRVLRGTSPLPTQSDAAAAAVDATATSSTSNDPILSLFNGQGKDRPSSFRDALTGRSGNNHLTPLPMHGVQQNWPLPATATQKMSSGFGFRADPLNRQPSFHGGIDIAAATGTPVLASADGIVTKVGREGLYGNSITVLHADGVESKYGHLSAMGVTIGQHVKTGQTIGAVGATGRVTGPHLDFRLAQDGVSIDPMNVLVHPGTEVASAAPSTSSSFKRPAIVTARSDRLIIVR